MNRMIKREVMEYRVYLANLYPVLEETTIM